MAKKKENVDLVKKQDAQPVTYAEQMESYFDRFFRHPISLGCLAGKAITLLSLKISVT